MQSTLPFKKTYSKIPKAIILIATTALSSHPTVSAPAVGDALSWSLIYKVTKCHRLFLPTPPRRKGKSKNVLKLEGNLPPI